MIRLEAFKVIRQLQVSQFEISPKRVKATYTVTQLNGETASTELIYTYEQAYFDKKNAADVNLASMMLAQVALNYGLFCEEIVLDGLYDAVDQSFLKNMLENTSREILTNKLLVKNEFLKPPFDSLKAEKRAVYTQAILRFENHQFAEMRVPPASLPSDQTKFAILSSGGKDSLLTYGLVREMGTAYPVFINESGRHWFTAVNAYRHFKEIEPNTEKPWCNSDRVFNWMLKHLPFIKENYANIRADIYPVRLWTVAVFLFGVLPVALKKGVGNILIGNEYDTTLRSTLEGISHYNGLYDQSKYFDNALTRYYQRKGWPIFQYSLLRSLSELLIMKTLLKRYPELQEHQVSCHAAHEEEGRMKPCGKCEKCRRIIGMVKALDESPEKCGYTPAQVAHGLTQLTQKPVKQIGSDAAELYFLLRKKELIGDNDFTRKAAKEHPEILKLRFDQERSTLEDLPEYVRAPLFEILALYADGAVQRQDGRWKAVELDRSFLFQKKYKLNV